MKRILVIEDEPTINMILEEVLTDEGYEVLTALNGQSGLKVMEEEALPNLVITDLRMPDISGRTVVETIRANPKLEEIPVIIISGAVSESDEFPAEGSYQAHLGKPFDLIDVISTVEELLQD